MPKLPSLPDDAVVADLFGAFPAHRETLFAHIDDVMRSPGAWDIAEREFIAAYVSALNACTYCLGAHVIYAEAFGLSADALEIALEDPHKADLSPQLAAMLTYLRLFQTLPHRATQADLDHVFAAGVSEAAVTQAFMIAGIYQLMNRLLEATGVTFDLRTAREKHGIARIKGDPRSHRYVQGPQQ